MKNHQPNVISGTKKDLKDERAPGVSAAEEKRYLRIQGQLEESLMGLAMLLGGFKVTQADALTLMQITPDYCDTWMNVARRDKRVLEIIERILRDSVWLPVVAVHAKLVAMIAQNHGLLKKREIKEEDKEKQQELSEEQRAMLILAGQWQERAVQREQVLAASEV